MEQFKNSPKKVNVKEIKPGDLLFFNCYGKSISHTVISVSNGGKAFIEAPFPGGKVRRHLLNKGYCGGKIAGVARYWNNEKQIYLVIIIIKDK